MLFARIRLYLLTFDEKEKSFLAGRRASLPSRDRPSRLSRYLPAEGAGPREG